MIDFLFITSPTNAMNPHPPYYFIYLIAYLEKHGLKCLLVDPKGGDTLSDIENHIDGIKNILKNNPSRFVGLSAFHSDYDMICRLGNMVKEIQPKTTLLVGNAHASLNPEDFIYTGSPFDIACIGEGEEVCLEISKTKNRSEWIDIKSIAYMNVDKEIAKQIEEVGIIITGKRKTIDMNNIGMPAYHHLDMGFYTKVQKSVLRRIYISLMPIFTGRGCPFNCSFCSANAIWKKNEGKICRMRNINSVIDEIKYLISTHHIDGFYLYDDMFGMDKEWTKKWFEEKGKFKEVPYACQTRVDIVNEDLIKNLKETGCIQIDFGVETGSQKMLDSIDKKITKEQIEKAFKLCEKYKIRSFACMLINLPDETEDDLKESYDFFKKINPTAGIVISITTPYPHSKIYKHCNPPLNKEEYSLLISNRLNPIPRFRMAKHDLDLGNIFNQWNIDFNVTPMFERMWAFNPFQKYYWLSVLKSKHKSDYIKMWIKDLVKTFILYWSHKLKFYRLLKKIQYRGMKKY